MVACKLGRFYVNDKQMTDVDYVLRNGDSIHHWGHRHEHPVSSFRKSHALGLDKVNHKTCNKNVGV